MKTQAITQTITLFLILMLSLTAHAKDDLPNSGDAAPDFEITQLDGTKFKLSDYKGKQAVYLVFWNTWCGFCMKKIPTLKNVEKNLPNELKVIAINTTNKDPLADVVDFKKNFNIPYSLAYDNDELITDLYNVWGTPTEFIIDINGVIQFRDDVPGRFADYLDEWNSIKTNP